MNLKEILEIIYSVMFAKILHKHNQKMAIFVVGLRWFIPLAHTEEALNNVHDSQWEPQMNFLGLKLLQN